MLAVCMFHDPNWCW